VKHESGRSPFWSSDEPTVLEIQQTRELYGLEKKGPQMQELQELGKEDYEGFFIPMMGNLIYYLFKSGIGFLILFLLFEYLIGPKLMDICLRTLVLDSPEKTVLELDRDHKSSLPTLLKLRSTLWD